MSHRLDPLLRPRSIAVLGATERAESVGLRTMENLRHGGYEGKLYAINPGRESVCGVRCYPKLSALPETVEHVVFAVSDYRIEAALDDAIAHGALAATIMSQLVIEGDSEPFLLERVETRIRESGLMVCGANAMGFYNCRDGVWVCGFDTRDNHCRGGNVTLVSHSGAGMSGIVDCEERIDFNLAVSTGQELCVAMHDYMDFAIEAHGTKVIGLFMETVRDPAAFISVLEKARQRRIPIVAIKVGRTALSARLAQLHSGAMAGEDTAYQALFDRYGVQRVDDMDEFTTALIMFAQPHPVAEGGLVSIHDSGGERQLLIDLADTMNVPLAEVNAITRARLEDLLDPGLPAVNPLDAWGAGGGDSDRIMEDSLAVLMVDPAAALGVVVHDRAPLSRIYPEYIDYIRKGHAASGKPVFLVSNRQGTGSDPLVIAATREGFPVLDGLRSFLRGVRCLIAYRDFCRREPGETPLVDEKALGEWRMRLAGCDSLGEAASCRMLADFGLPMNPAVTANDETEALAAAEDLGYPVVLKTASPGIHHKTDQKGVMLKLRDTDALTDAYRDMASRLGPSVLVSSMVTAAGVELMLGMVKDEQFGSLVMMGFGGVNIEVMKDVVCAFPPFDAATAKRLMDSLRQRPLLDAQRGAAGPDLDAFCEMAANFSAMVAGLGDVIEEIDINPVIVHADGCVCVDALVVAGGMGS